MKKIIKKTLGTFLVSSPSLFLFGAILHRDGIAGLVAALIILAVVFAVFLVIRLGLNLLLD